MTASRRARSMNGPERGQSAMATHGRKKSANGLKANATLAQMKSGFQWACEYGRTRVVDFLLQRGIDVGEMHRGQTGLHWAAYAGHADIVRRLLERNAPIDLRDERWRNTPLGWALHGWKNPLTATAETHYYDVVSLLVAAGSTVELESIPDETLRADSRMLAALRGETTASQSAEP